MLAKAGVTTAIDFAGPVEEIHKDLPEFGTGLNIGCCNAILPMTNINSNNPSKKEIEEFIDDRLEKGSLGIKILGGHFPLTPAAIKHAIEYCNKKKVFVASHAGSTETGSNIKGMEEAIKLAADNRLYVAHVNAYCRGLIEDPISEVLIAIELLKNKKNIFSGSHLGTINGTSAKCTEGKPASHVTRNCLRMREYEISEHGLEKAILDGYGLIHIETDRGTEFITGSDGVKRWKEAKTNSLISFPVNRSDSNFLLATDKDKKCSFIVDVISTDGGSIPRNLLLERGLCLVKFGSISIKEMVTKMSLTPANLLGLANKGHLTVGADADFTIFDYEKQNAVHSIVNGNFVLKNRRLVGKRGKVLVTKNGVKYVNNIGMLYTICQPEKSTFYQ